MARIVLIPAVIDTERPLGPQVAAARAQHVPWKVLEEKLGIRRQQLERLMHRAAGCGCCAFATDSAAAARAH